jgi:hypothetical protein
VKNAVSPFADPSRGTEVAATVLPSLGLSRARLWITALAAMATFAALGAPAAHASKEVVGWVGNQTGSGGKGNELSSPRDVAVNRSGAGPASPGDIYVAEQSNNRIQQFDSEGNFIRAWGGDVVSEGGTGDVDHKSFEICEVASQCKAGIGRGDNEVPTTNERKWLTFNNDGNGPRFQTGDFFKLGNLPAACSASETAPIEYFTNQFQIRSRIESAWNAKCGAGTIVSSEPYPGKEGSWNPVFEFGGIFAGVDLPTLACITISSVQGASCAESTLVNGAPAVPPTLAGNGILNNPQSVAVDNDTGNVYVSDLNNRRIDEYEGDGTFLRAFGWDVVASGPDNTGTGYEICVEAEGDLCKAGTAGSGVGQFGSGSTNGTFGIAVSPDGEASEGTVFLADAGNRRVDTYELDGTAPSSFGDSEVFGTNQPRKIATDANGILYASNSAEGGQIVRYDTSASVDEVQTITIQATGGNYKLGFKGEETGEIEWNATAGEIETALNGLTAINAGGGSVSVAGGPGDETGSTPYEVTFDGVPLASTNVAQLVATNVSLTGGNPNSAATVNTTTQGGPTLMEPILASTEGKNEHKQITFNQVGPSFVAGDTYKLGNLPASCSASETKTLEFTNSASEMVSRIKEAWEEKCGAGGISGSSGPFNPQFDFSGQWAETNIPTLTCTTISGSGVCADINDIDGSAAGSRALLAGAAATATAGLAVSESGVLYVLRDPSQGHTVVQQFNEAGEPTAPTVADDTHGGGANFQAGVQGLGLDPGTGNVYVSATEAITGLTAGNRVYFLNEVHPTATVDSVDELTGTSATVHGTIDPGLTSLFPNFALSYSTQYRLKEPPNQEWTEILPSPVTYSGAPIAVETSLSELTPNREYQVRFLPNFRYMETAVEGEVGEFTTEGARPRIDAVWATEVRETTAKVHALIDRFEYPTTYCFEYGTTTNYGSEQPNCPGSEVPEVEEVEEVEAVLTGLNPGSVYHYRVRATSTFGTSTSADRTFDFSPPTGCPNDVVRQQTGAAYLPDCRGYELVSPSQLGGAALLPGGPATPSSEGRFAYSAILSSLPGTGEPPNGAFSESGDLYVASRTPSGWKTKYVGPPGYETISTRGASPEQQEGGSGYNESDQNGTGLNSIPTDTAMNRFAVYDAKGAGCLACAEPLLGSNAPYLYDNEGHFLGRLPTNLEEADGGIESPPRDLTEGGFWGTGRLSGDGQHYIFTSKEVPFAPGGLEEGPGSVYDDNISTGTVTLISDTEAGVPIESDPAGQLDASKPLEQQENIIPRFVSEDGSHVLMSTRGAREYWVCNFEGQCGTGTGFGPGPRRKHLYMHDSNASKTYEVSWDSITNENVAVTYEGVAEGGRTVYFSTEVPMTAEDEDTSIDLYMWSETTNSVKLISAPGGQGGAGNHDGCSAEKMAERPWQNGSKQIPWIPDCGIEVVPFQEFHCGSRPCRFHWEECCPAQASHSAPYDSSIASEAGDIYFYSPEVLQKGHGLVGARNMYVYHDGSVKFVARLKGAGSVEGQDGNLDSEWNGGASRINVSADGKYMAFITTSRVTHYDNAGKAEMYVYDREAETITCASCRPEGTPPSFSVEGSQDGRFMTDEGKVFFATKESLVPRDGNGISDVYEFVGARPQLITSGTGSEEGTIERAGLVNVTANGTDVFFGTYDTLVGQDESGGVYKFYDARTNGGFPFNRPPAPCEAADECHGPESQPAPPLQLGTGQDLAETGQVPAKKKHRKKHRKKHKKKHKHRRHHRRHTRHARGNG